MGHALTELILTLGAISLIIFLQVVLPGYTALTSKPLPTLFRIIYGGYAIYGLGYVIFGLLSL